MKPQQSTFPRIMKMSFEGCVPLSCIFSSGCSQPVQLLCLPFWHISDCCFWVTRVLSALLCFSSEGRWLFMRTTLCSKRYDTFWLLHIDHVYHPALVSVIYQCPSPFGQHNTSFSKMNSSGISENCWSSMQTGNSVVFLQQALLASILWLAVNTMLNSSWGHLSLMIVFTFCAWWKPWK